MPPRATGTVYCLEGRRYARIRISAESRPSFALPTCATDEAARARAAVLAELAVRLRRAGQERFAEAFVSRAAERDGKALDAVLAAAAAVCRGEAGPKPNANEITIERLAARWTSGELAREYPDHVRTKKSAGDDVTLFDLHILPIVRHVPVVKFTLDDAEAVMRSLPPRAAATRRHVAQAMHRLLNIAVFPVRLIAANPLPKGFLPKLGPAKAKGALYPDEDATLLGCIKLPFCWRLLWGFLDREGPRASEAAALEVRDFDLLRGGVRLDENKTDDPRAWALSAGMAQAIRTWLEHRGVADQPDARVFVDENSAPIDPADDHLAARFRAHLEIAGVDRPELFERSASRMWIRAHDLRGTFVTISLANGKSETWVADRTGHKSSVMINGYRRAARTVAELGLGELVPLDRALPELAAMGSRTASGGGGGGTEMQQESERFQAGSPGRTRTDNASRRRILNPLRLPFRHGAQIRILLHAIFARPAFRGARCPRPAPMCARSLQGGARSLAGPMPGSPPSRPRRRARS